MYVCIAADVAYAAGIGTVKSHPIPTLEIMFIRLRTAAQKRRARKKKKCPRSGVLLDHLEPSSSSTRGLVSSGGVGASVETVQLCYVRSCFRLRGR